MPDVTHSDYPYRVLIVEDDANWSELIVRRLRQLGISADIAPTIVDAQNQFRNWRYHLVSCDMRMPEKDKGEAEVSKGVKFSLSTRQQGPAPILLRILTGQADKREPMDWDNVEQIHRLGGRLDESIFHKSPDGLNRPERNEYSQQGWAEKIAEWLRDPELPRKLLQGGRERLPFPLARIAAHLEQLWPQSGKLGDFWRGFRDLYLATLHLAWAQMLALGRHYEVTLNSAYNDKEAQKIAELRQFCHELKTHNWKALAPWRPYFLDQSATGENPHSLIGEGLLKTLNDWRKWRNADAHRFTPSSWIGEMEEQRYQILRLIDLAAFWTVHPLLASFQFISAKGNAEVVKICGTTAPFPVVEIPLDTQLRSQNGHVYLEWTETDKGLELIDLWPWVHLKFNPADPRGSLCVVSHAKSERNITSWYRCNLMELASAELWIPTHEERGLLEKTWRRQH